MNDLTMDKVLTKERERLLHLAHIIQPIDDTESTHLAHFEEWVHSNEPLYRIQKPAVPAKHLAVFSCVVDASLKNLLMVHHKDADFWLPPGGHVEPQEAPLVAASRELHEEISTPTQCLSDLPLMLSWKVVGEGPDKHTDVTFWYLFQGDASKLTGFDPLEFHAVQWVPIHSIAEINTSNDVRRFIKKLSLFLSSFAAS